LAGVSRATFADRYVDSGLVRCEPGRRGMKLVSLASLEAALGRGIISCTMYCLAERERDGARRYQAAYNLNHLATPARAALDQPRALPDRNQGDNPT
jgi:hypothetical protein